MSWDNFLIKIFGSSDPYSPGALGTALLIYLSIFQKTNLIFLLSQDPSFIVLRWPIVEHASEVVYHQDISIPLSKQSHESMMKYDYSSLACTPKIFPSPSGNHFQSNKIVSPTVVKATPTTSNTSTRVRSVLYVDTCSRTKSGKLTLTHAA